MAERDGVTPRDGSTQLSPTDGGGGGRPTNLMQNPVATPPRRATDFSAVQRQQVASKPTSNVGDAPGGRILHADAPAQRPGGVGSVGNASRPFRLAGG